jgi:DNA-binding transcriptional ArsR family regulator
MLDINLIRERPALKVEFRPSLVADIFEGLSLVLDAPSIEGVDQWVYETHAALPAILKNDMEAVLVLINKSEIQHLWISQLPTEAPAHTDFAALITWLNAFPVEDYRVLIERAMTHMAECCITEETPAASLETIDILRATFGEKLSAAQLERAQYLVDNPAELKAQFIAVITRFWEQFYREEYQRCLPLATRSVAYHQQQSYNANFSTVFTAITGRRVPKDLGDYDHIERVVFIPSCHIGPYVMLHMCEECQNIIMIHYNCRPTGTVEHEKTEEPMIQDLFPPLKALADETRLQILALLNEQELYAQEIVNALDISQSAISRHLQLMVTGGLLTMRKEESMKYFSINEETLATLAAGLLNFHSQKS